MDGDNREDDVVGNGGAWMHVVKGMVLDGRRDSLWGGSGVQVRWCREEEGSPLRLIYKCQHNGDLPISWGVITG